MTPYDCGYPKERYEERVREAAEDHLAARVVRANRQHEHRAQLRDIVTWLRSVAADKGIAVLRGRHA